MLTREQITQYNEIGFLALENVVPIADIECARAVVEEFVARSREITQHDAVYDLEPGHSADAPRVRRLKEPWSIHPIFRQIGGSDALLEIVTALLGSARYQASKLNMKSAQYGSPVEWHQDFAFYPHTNDDLLAVGIALDDCTLENGCMLMVPGAHRGPIYSHHQEDVFVGAIDHEKEGVDVSRAVPVPVRAGGITIHHCRMLHASATNVSQQPRRLYLVQYTAVDAWPLMGVPDLAKFDSQILRGEPTRTYRLNSPDSFVRIPLPMPENQGSIYEIQTAFRPKVFAAR